MVFYLGVLFVMLPLAAAIADIIAAAVVLAGARERNVAWSFASLAICLASWSTAAGLTSIGFVETHGTTVRWLRLGLLLLPAVGLHNAVVFSEVSGRRIRALVVFGYIVAVGLSVLNFGGFVASGLVTYSWGSVARPGPLYPVVVIFLIVWGALGVFICARALRQSSSARIRLRVGYWLLGAAVFMPLAMGNVLPNYGVSVVSTGSIGNIWLVGLYAYAAFRHRLMDIDMFIMRTAATLVAGAAIVAPVAGAAIWAQHLPLGANGVVVGSLFLAAIVSLFVFSRFRSYLIQEVEDSLFPARRVARAAIRQLSMDLVKLSDFDDLAPQIASTLVDGLRVEGLAVYLRTRNPGVLALACSHGILHAPQRVRSASLAAFSQASEARADLPPHRTRGHSPADRSGDELGWEACLPIESGGSQVGAIAVGPKRSGGAIDDSDLTLLRMVSSQLAIAVKNAEYVQQIERQKVEIEELNSRIEAENVVLRAEVRTASQFKEIIGSSPALHEVLLRVERVAPTSTSILITGETGTGKELIARAIHELSPRRTGPLICVNCAAIPTSLAESELFGHERGAFTDAVQSRPGKFELAHHGTIFLDEVGELSPELQVKLLRVLQEHEVQRVGGSKVLKLDLRVVAATNRDLRREMHAGRFREDLYYRLATFVIDVPALRERADDIPMLASCFVGRAATLHQKHIKGFTVEALDILSRYTWPGNIRELQNVVERAVLLCNADTITPEHLSDLAVGKRSGRSFGMAMREEKTRRVLQALTHTRGNQAAAARLLGISPNNLARLMKNLGLKSPRSVH